MADLGTLIKDLAEAKAALKERQNAVKGAEEVVEKAKLAYLDALGAAGLTEARNNTHSATRTEKILPHVESWDEFLSFIHDNKYYHLLQRRPSTTGCEELLAQGSIPGVVPFKKVDVSLRSL